MHEDRFTCIEEDISSDGGVTSAVSGSLGDGCACKEGVGGVGFACTGSGGVDFFCTSDNDKAGGAVRSRQDAAQSQ